MDSYNLKYQGKGINIYVHQNVLDIWQEYRQVESGSHESFGVLIGSFSCDMTEFWIESVTVPCPDDTSSRYSFFLKDKCHQQAVNKSFELSKGKSIYCGTWHTHPEKYPLPSSTDLKDWKKCIKRNQDRLLFFLIIGTDEMCLFKYSNDSFERLIINKDDAK